MNPFFLNDTMDMSEFFNVARFYFVSMKWFMEMLLVMYEFYIISIVPCKSYVLVLYHVCRDFSNGTKVMLLVI